MGWSAEGAPGRIERGLARWIDPVLERAIGAVARRGPCDPIRSLFAEERRKALVRVRSSFGESAAALGPLVVSGARPAIEAFDELADDAIRAMRAEVARGGREPLGRFALRALDRRLFRDAHEIMDDPSFSSAKRTKALATLDRFNAHAGSYATFASLLAPLVEAAERARAAPVRVHDVAAGHGGFAVYLKRSLGERVRVEASDICSDYLAHGRARAAALGLDVAFMRQDALRLDALVDRGVDVITCTQSLHHFSPGAVARMIAEAARVARVGVCFVDGERSWLFFVLLSIAAALYGRTYAFAHDASVSIRRMFYEEELALLASLAPAMPTDVRIETGTAAPAHAFVRVFRSVA